MHILDIENVKVLTIHGFNVKDNAKGTTDKALTYFRRAGFVDVKDFDYGWFELLAVRFMSDKVAKRLAEEIGDTPTIVFCHSHGNVIADIAAKKYNANIVYHVAVNPALNIKTQFATKIDYIDVYHNEKDCVVTTSKWLRRLSPLSWVNIHPWGEAGRKGIKTNDRRVVNIDTINTENMPEAAGHSGMFDNKNVPYWMTYAVKRVVERMSHG